MAPLASARVGVGRVNSCDALLDSSLWALEDDDDLDYNSPSSSSKVHRTPPRSNLVVQDSRGKHTADNEGRGESEDAFDGVLNHESKAFREDCRYPGEKFERNPHAEGEREMQYEVSDSLFHENLDKFTVPTMRPTPSGRRLVEDPHYSSRKRDRGGGNWRRRSISAAGSVMSFFKKDRRQIVEPSGHLAVDLLDFCLSVCAATASECIHLAELAGPEEYAAVRRICALARKAGVLGKPPSSTEELQTFEVAHAFISQAQGHEPPPKPSSSILYRTYSNVSNFMSPITETEPTLPTLNHAKSNLSLTSSSGLRKPLLRSGTDMSILSVTSSTDFNAKHRTLLQFATSLSEGPRFNLDTSENLPEYTSESAVSYKSHLDVNKYGGQDQYMVQNDVFNLGGDRGIGNVKIGFKSQCLRTQNEWQKHLLIQQRALLDSISTKLQDVEKSLRAEDNVKDEQKEILRGFRRIVTKEPPSKEGMMPKVMVYVVDKTESSRQEMVDLCRILELPVQVHASIRSAEQAMKGVGLQRDTGQLVGGRTSRATSAGLAIPLKIVESRDWRSRVVLPSKRRGSPAYEAEEGNKKWKLGELTPKGTLAVGAEEPFAKIVLLAAGSWLDQPDKELPPSWQTMKANGDCEAPFVVLTSGMDLFEVVARTLLVGAESAEMRDKLHARGINEYLLRPLSLDGLQGVVGEAARRCFGEEYLVSRTLGRGTSGVVHQVKSLRDGTGYALKEINTRSLGKKAKQRLEAEKDLLKKLQWPSCMFLIDSWANTKDHLCYFLLPLLAGGNVQAMIDAAKTPEGQSKLTDDVIADWYVQALHGVVYMHHLGVVHRDIKPENMMLAGDERSLLMADYGSAATLPGTGPHPQRSAVVKGTYGMSPAYAAPEAFTEEILFYASSDVWSVGVSFFEARSRLPLVTNCTGMEAVRDLLKELDIPTVIRQSIQDIGGTQTPSIKEIEAMLRIDPIQRPSAAQLLNTDCMLNKLEVVLREVMAVELNMLPTHISEVRHIAEESVQAYKAGR